MKVKVTAHVFYQKFDWEPKGKFLVFYVKIDDADSFTYVGEQEIEIEVPYNYDPRAQKIAALEKQKQKVMAEFQKTVDQINERISNLQALEYTA